MNRAVKMATTAILTNVPRFGPHLPYRKAMMAVPTVTQVNARPTMISPAVPSGLLTTKAFSVAMTVAESVPPIQMGLESRYSTVVTAPNLPLGRRQQGRPKDFAYQTGDRPGFGA